MDWLVEIHKETSISAILNLPKSEVPSKGSRGPLFQASINGQVHKAQWHQTLNLLTVSSLAEPALKRNYKIRSVTFDETDSDPQIGYTIEYICDLGLVGTLRGVFSQHIQGIAKAADSNAKKSEGVKSPMAGTVLKVLVENQSEVKKGDVICIIEAMKMENQIKAPRPGKIVNLRLKALQKVNANEMLCQIHDI